MGLPTVASNFTGKAAGFYISAALKQANSLEYMRVLENIKFKSNIQKMAASGLIADATCDFTQPGGAALDLSEKQLTPKLLQVNLDICKADLLDSWEALEMRAGAGAPPPASFTDYVLSYIGEIIAENTENSIWTGTAVAGQFNGFLGAVTGYLLAVPDPTVVQTAAAATPFTAGNIVSNLQTLIGGITGGTAANILGKEDAYIYMNQKTYQFYISAMSSLNYINMSQMNADYVPYFEGVKIAVCNGMADDELVFAETSNLFFGTDLLSDATRIQTLDMSQLDGSDNIRVVCRYSAGVQSGIGSDIVRLS